MSKLSLQRREKMVLTVGAVVVALVLVQYLAKGPLNAHEAAAQAVAQARSNYDHARLLREDVIRQQSAAEALQRLVRERKAQGLITTLNQVAVQANLRQPQRANIETTTAVATSENFEQARVTLTGVTIEEVVDFLHRLYASGTLVTAPVAEIQPNPNGEGLRCTLIFLSPRV